MIRLTLLLCAGLYFGFLVLGEDHGQKRYGLMLADEQARAAELAAAEAALEPVADPVTEVVFIPAQTVMEPAEAVAVVVETPALADEVAVTEVASEPATLPEPQMVEGTLFTVAAEGANVRFGPGKNFDVVGRLSRGEEVLVLTEASPVDGWSKIRLEGDGIEGYVATRLLTQ